MGSTMTEKENIYDCLYIYGQQTQYKPDICEAFRLKFIILKYLIGKQYAFVCDVFKQLGAVREEGFWRTSFNNIDSIVAKLQEGGYEVETLERAITWLKRTMYSPMLRRELGKKVFVKLPTKPNAIWHYLDVQKRAWGKIAFESSKEMGEILPEGTVVRQKVGEEENYFLVVRGGDLQPLTKRSALNIAARTFGPRTIAYAVEGELMAVRADEVGLLPDEIFSLIVRLRPTKEYRQKIFLFYARDVPLVSELFSLVNISLSKGSFRLREYQKKARTRGFIYKPDERRFLKQKRIYERKFSDMSRNRKEFV
jgi:hypothetical protein